MKKFEVEIPEEDFAKLRKILEDEKYIEKDDEDFEVIAELFWESQNEQVLDLRDKVKVKEVK